MSLNKLAIRGIRSFDDKEMQVIEFFSPVTVIVGHNGSGKTTIIECLKYATTGEQPPGTRGGAFVHDPKIANEKEVKAQVRLRFNAANGHRMLVQRNLSVSIKKTGALAMKTLESLLSIVEPGEGDGKRGTISTKCAEMDSEIPSLLGVSKAVLENVIFCHQEDSYWPLSEPAALKKKFDDIFEATKYTKALDNIKALRKDRVSDLKAEKERMESLSREKAHADKLKSRISELGSTISAKEVECDSVKERYDMIVIANKKFYESATKFRETYVQLDALNEKKRHYQEELENARENLQEIPGTDEELAHRLKNFSDHIMQQKRDRSQAHATLQDIEEDLNKLRSDHMAKVGEHGKLAAEAKANEDVLREREETIRELSAKYQLKGFDHTPLEKEAIITFISRITELQRQQNNETDELQSKQRRHGQEYTAKSRQLHSELERYRQQKDMSRENISTLQTRIHAAEREVDAAEGLTTKQKTVEADIEDKARRIGKVKAEIDGAKFEEQLGDRANKIRDLELKKEALGQEIHNLSFQADTRARLDLKREQVKQKESDVKNAIEINNAKFRKLIGTDIRAETMKADLERGYKEKDGEREGLEHLSDSASRSLQAVETSLSDLRKQLKAKKEEIKSLDTRIKAGLEGADSTITAVAEAEAEVNTRREELSRSAGASSVYKHFLQFGASKKRCPLCERAMNAEVLSAYEKNVNERIKKASPESIKETSAELSDWEEELKRLQALGVLAASRDKLAKIDVPQIESEIKEKEGQLPELTQKAEQTTSQLNVVKKELREIIDMKQVASTVTTNHEDILRLQGDIKDLQTSLLSTGSTRTADDVQTELDALKSEIRTAERERQSLQAERERMQATLRATENKLHALQLNLGDLQKQLMSKSSLEKQIQEMRLEIAKSAETSRALDVKIAEAAEPIQRLDQQHAQAEADLSAKIREAQRSSQELNMNVDKLEGLNKTIDRYIRGKGSRRLKECLQEIDNLEADIAAKNTEIDQVRAKISGIDKEINEGGAVIASLRENIRVRKLIKDITATQAQMETFDVEEAARAQRNFDTNWPIEQRKESDLQTKHAHLTGELSSLQSQLKVLQADFAEFKNIAKRYKDQLIKVKLSDMANNDLEKYAKALDNAIMKYHSLKMEEVNDTMRHLWNKTYQGTDIDGIKICSDSEGGATKRSYNYRVVMTKDQVEMDMRGRCSAGQKMLASIIIRLALADSFGQNCGILALDEPTNALDTENVDALAASLVDLINERKHHANFQLIVITHDENFLRKLGQNDVIEHYWRVSRDARQKSFIERHRFG